MENKARGGMGMHAIVTMQGFLLVPPNLSHLEPQIPFLPVFPESV